MPVTETYHPPDGKIGYAAGIFSFNCSVFGGLGCKDLHITKPPVDIVGNRKDDGILQWISTKAGFTAKPEQVG